MSHLFWTLSKNPTIPKALYSQINICSTCRCCTALNRARTVSVGKQPICETTNNSRRSLKLKALSKPKTLPWKHRKGAKVVSRAKRETSSSSATKINNNILDRSGLKKLMLQRSPPCCNSHLHSYMTGRVLSVVTLYCSIKKKVEVNLYLKEVQLIYYVQYCVFYTVFKKKKK